jgi:hypothetical protein
MNVRVRFLAAELAWTAGILALMVPMALLDNDPPNAAHFIRWVARAIGLAAFPAGISVAPAVFGEKRAWRPLGSAFAAASVVAVVAFALLALVVPAVAEQERTIPQLLSAMSTDGESWETRNDAAWDFYTILFAPVNALLFAAIGVQVGAWSRHSLRPAIRRPLYWAVGLGLLISGYAIWDTTYETIVLHTAADASFAAFYTLLLPASICAGLALPTLALVRDGGPLGSTS